MSSVRDRLILAMRTAGNCRYAPPTDEERADAVLAVLDSILTDPDIVTTAAKSILVSDITLGFAADEWEAGADQVWLRHNAVACFAALRDHLGLNGERGR